LQLDFPACFLNVASLYFIFFILILKKGDFWGITQNWVMTNIILSLDLLSLKIPGSNGIALEINSSTIF
jgi:hypothetical protein